MTESRDPELPPPPPLSSFVERTPLRLLAEAGVGAGAGFLVAGALGMEGWRVAAAGGILAPLALLLTPVSGGLVARAVRYGLALAVLGMLLVSFTGPGDERPVDELLGIGFLLLVVGGLGHGVFLGAVERRAS
jgi:hypothetical protein